MAMVTVACGSLSPLCANPSRLSLGVRGMATQMVARDHALNGDSDSAHRRLYDAQNLITRAASRQEDEPAWVYFQGDTWLTAQRGMIETELAEHGKTNPQLAITLLEKALADLPDSYQRDRAWHGAMLQVHMLPLTIAMRCWHGIEVRDRCGSREPLCGDRTKAASG